ncbi:YebC/PmpR family DNA-binding transcriptional regulator [bacterium]|nr:YebC/PmpR family DNA-binding transcriptional regulator [bacterium]NCQ55666.1 YebC/PmpR family DNA-binding transcriptional regulator [Candidatus Parcubacteria bacterium]NCS67491.1 YebC/PmpR family DNA-binding transcriptional regulator [Candidatus Peregrinibacteria bacterium]NCS96217.1 YebC/PmpR family DNA-binding transcriptional regulator [bacterium]
MAGHSKWKQIKHKKGANDLKRGKLLTKHGKLLQVIGRDNPNPETNAALRNAIVNAKTDGVPRENIERVLKKLSGQGSNAAVFTENLYEGYGPAGIPIIVSSLTDNSNRAFTNIRTAFNKHGGNLGSSGSVAFMFDHVGEIQFALGERNEEQLFELIANAGADDFEVHENTVMVSTTFESLGKVRQALTEQGIEIEKAEPTFQAKDPVELSSGDQKKLDDFLEALNQVDDIDEIFTGAV